MYMCTLSDVSGRRTGNKPRLTSVFMKIIMSTLQVNAIALSYSFDWDALMAMFLSGQGQITSLGIAMVQIGCFQSNPEKNFALETFVYGMFPLIIILIVFLGVLMSKFFCKTQSNSSDTPGPVSSDESVQMEEQAQAEATEEGQEDRSAAQLAVDRHTMWKGAKDDATGVAVIVLFLLQPYLVKRFALLFSCSAMGKEDTDLFLTEDLGVQCYSSTHYFYITTLGVPLLLLYVIGAPLAVYLVLNIRGARRKVMYIMDWANTSTPTDMSLVAEAENSEVKEEEEEKRQVQPKKDTDTLDARTVVFLNNYAFLFLGYSKKRHSWEVLVIVRKALLSLIGVALAGSPPLYLHIMHV